MHGSTYLRRAVSLWGTAGLVIALAAVCAWAPATPAGGQAAAGPATRAASQGDWPQFHGPRRDNLSDETHLLKRWPDGGPKLLWQAKGLGHGYATVAIAGGMLYTTGNVKSDTVITAMDLESKVVWRAKNGPAYRRSQPGTRCTPTLHEGKLYHLNADGDLACLDAKTGKAIWAVNILKAFDGRNIEWGLAESPLIVDDKVICSPGGEETSMVALHKDTGKTVWTCRGAGDKPGYSSAILVDYGGLRQVVTLMSASAVGVNAQTGKLLWRFPHPANFDENIMTPVYHDGRVFVSTGHRRGGVLLKLHVDQASCTVTPAWRNEDLDNQHGGVVLVGGYLFGHSHRGRWVCVEWDTGKTMYSVPGLRGASGCLTWADGMLYLVSEPGIAALMPPDPKEFKPVSQFEVPRGGRGPAWAHPVVCARRLYLRHSDVLSVYDVGAK